MRRVGGLVRVFPEWLGEMSILITHSVIGHPKSMVNRKGPWTQHAVCDGCGAFLYVGSGEKK